MILDFKKLFPKSCEGAGISSLHINIDEIRYLKQLVRPKIGFAGQEYVEDTIQVGDTTFRFTSVDDGITILNSIISAKNLLADYELTKDIISKEKLPNLEKQIEVCKQYLNETILKYGTHYTP